MSKRSMVIAGIAALVVVAIAAAVLLTSRNAPSSGASAGKSETTSGTAGSGSVPGQTDTTGTGGTVGKGKITNIGPFPALPDTKVPAPSHAVSTPAAEGQALAPLTDAPANTISGLQIGQLPEEAQYSVQLRPYGIGPSIVLGSRLAVLLDSAKPAKGAPAYSRIVNANLLVLVDTTHGGTITKGGKYSATLTFRSDGGKLLPILSNAKAVN